MSFSNGRSCETGSFSCLHNPHRISTVRGFDSSVSCAETLALVVCVTPQLFLPAYRLMNVGPPCPPATTSLAWSVALPCVISTQPPVTAPPTDLDEYFFFNSLVVRLLYSSVFWQFCLVFVFKLVVVLLLVVRGSKTYLPIPPFWPEVQHIDFLEVSSSVADSVAAVVGDSPVEGLMCWLAAERSYGPSTSTYRGSAAPPLLILTNYRNDPLKYSLPLLILKRKS